MFSTFLYSRAFREGGGGVGQVFGQMQRESDDSRRGCNEGKWYKDLFVPGLHDR